MVSAIDPSKPADGVPAIKLDLRGNLQAARDEIEALQAGKTDVGHQHVLADIADAGALAGKSVVALGDIASAAVTSTELGAAAVVEAALADGAVTTAKIAAAAVTGAQIAPDAIAAAALADGAVTTAKIEDAAVTEAKVAASAIAEAALADGAVSTAKLADAAVAGSKLAPAAIDTVALADGAVTNAKVADAAVTSGKLADAAVTEAKLDDAAVATAKLADAAVTEAKLDDAAVATAKLADAAVTGVKIDDAAVGTAKIADAAVVRAKIAPAAIGADQLEDGIPIDMQDAVLHSPELRDFAETSPAATVSSGVLTLNYEAGSVFEVTLTENVATLALVNPPAPGRAGSCTVILRQDGTGGRTLAWPAAVRWPGGSAPEITATPNAIDVISLVTRDGGATWFGFPSGQAFS